MNELNKPNPVKIEITDVCLKEIYDELERALSIAVTYNSDQLRMAEAAINGKNAIIIKVLNILHEQYPDCSHFPKSSDLPKGSATAWEMKMNKIGEIKYEPTNRD